MIKGRLGRLNVGDREPVRLMGVINLGWESFYKGSIAGPDDVLARALALEEEGADLIDIGAVSTAPGSPPISEPEERARLIPALKELAENLSIDISVDTQRASIAEDALELGAACINDVSGLGDKELAGCVADHDGSLIIMAGDKRPGDILTLDEIIPCLGKLVQKAISSGVDSDKISVDPGIGKWIPEKTPPHDLAIIDGFARLKCLGRPTVAAVSRKSFIGQRLNQPDPKDRLSGTLAATAIAVYLGAHIVRTHDVLMSRDTVEMARAIRGHSIISRSEDIEAEVLDFLGVGEDSAQIMQRTGVDGQGYDILARKAAFRIISLRGLSSMEALVIKQEMLARGGDAAIPRLALRCDPRPEEVLIFGTSSQISGLVKNLKKQPFRLMLVAERIDEALLSISGPERYR